MAIWTNPLARHGVYWGDIEKLPEVNAGVNDFMANEVVPAWKANSPTGAAKKNRSNHKIKSREGADDIAYKDSIQVTEKSVGNGRGVVGATAAHAHLVEFGSVHNKEHAPAEKTAKQFGGSAHGK